MCVSPTSQRQANLSIGSLLLAQVLRDAAHLKTVLITAPTPSAAPFYAKRGLKEVVYRELNELRLPGMKGELPFYVYLYTPQGKAAEEGKKGRAAAEQGGTGT